MLIETSAISKHQQPLRSVNRSEEQNLQELQSGSMRLPLKYSKPLATKAPRRRVVDRSSCGPTGAERRGVQTQPGWGLVRCNGYSLASSFFGCFRDMFHISKREAFHRFRKVFLHSWSLVWSDVFSGKEHLGGLWWKPLGTRGNYRLKDLTQQSTEKTVSCPCPAV